MYIIIIIIIIIIIKFKFKPAVYRIGVSGINTIGCIDHFKTWLDFDGKRESVLQ